MNIHLLSSRFFIWHLDLLACSGMTFDRDKLLMSVFIVDLTQTGFLHTYKSSQSMQAHKLYG